MDARDLREVAFKKKIRYKGTRHGFECCGIVS
jgi:hypothetical protein